MAKKSRRLPGGKVRKPLAQRPRPADPGAAAPVMDGVDEIEEIDEAVETAPPPALTPATAGMAVAPVHPAPAVRPAPVARPPAVEPRRTGVGARRVGAAGAVAHRRSTSQMDLVAANYGHIRADLARIGVLAAIMFGIIIALAFVFR